MKFATWLVFQILLLFVCLGLATESRSQNALPKRPYTIAEYNALTLAGAERNQGKQIEMLDGFVAQFPTSALLPYIYPLYVKAYAQVGDYPRVIKFADKLLALGDEADAVTKYAVVCAWVDAYSKLYSEDTSLATKAKDRANVGLKLIPLLEKPDGMDAQTFEAEKRRGIIHLQLTIAGASLVLKDAGGARESIRAVETLDGYDPRPLTEPKRRVVGF